MKNLVVKLHIESKTSRRFRFIIKDGIKSKISKAFCLSISFVKDIMALFTIPAIYIQNVYIF